METSTEAPVKTPAEASDFAEFRKIRSGEQVPATPPQQPPAETAGEEAEIEAGSEPVEKPTQEQPETKPEKRDRTLEGRIKELRSKGKHDEANKLMVDAAVRAHKDEVEQLRKELQESRTRKPEEPKPAPAPAAENKLDGDDPKPRLAAFMKDGKSYEDAIEEHADAVADWRDRKRERETSAAAADRQKAEMKTSFTKRLTEVRAKHSDFDEVTKGLSLTPPMQQFVMEADEGLEVIRELGVSPDDYQRIAELSPTRQLAELGKIALRLEAPPPEKPKTTPVSRVPAPPRTVSGTEPATAKATNEAKSFEEHKRLRTARS